MQVSKTPERQLFAWDRKPNPDGVMLFAAEHPPACTDPNCWYRKIYEVQIENMQLDTAKRRWRRSSRYSLAKGSLRASGPRGVG